jgi:hypothetical protein
MPAKKITIEAVESSSTDMSLEDKVNSLLEEMKVITMKLDLVLRATSEDKSTKTVPKPKPKAASVIRKKVLPKTFWQAKVCDNDNIPMYKLFSKGGKSAEWINALSLADNADFSQRFTTLVSSSDKWANDGCFENTDDGLKLPPKIEDLFSKGDVAKGKKSVFAQVWDNYMSTLFKTFMKDLMTASELDIATPEENKEDKECEQELKNKKSAMVDFEESD